MKCTGKEWDHCRVEKMGCFGCYHNENKKDNTFKASIPLITEEEKRTIDNNFESLIDMITKQIVHEKDLAISQYVIKKQQCEIEELKNEKAEVTISASAHNRIIELEKELSKEKDQKGYYQKAFDEVRQQKEEILLDKNVVLKSTLKEILEKYRYAPADNIETSVQFYKELQELL